VKKQRAELLSAQFAARTALEDPEGALRALGFAAFAAGWLLRAAEPAHAHPRPPAPLPLPRDVPMAFRCLPEYLFADVVETLLFYARCAPAPAASCRAC
jgi:ubiquitin conjugation factor E4 B